MLCQCKINLESTLEQICSTKVLQSQNNKSNVVRSVKM